MSVSFDDSELRKLRADLSSAGNRVGGKVSRALRTGGEQTKRMAKSLAPKDSHELADSIEASYYGDGRSGSMTAVIGPTARHGLFQEKGTAKMSAQPYLSPSLNATAPGVIRAIEQAVSEVLP